MFDKKSFSVKEIRRSEFAWRLTKARKAAGLSQKAVVTMLQEHHAISLSTLANYEQDKAVPRVDVFVDLCKLYGITPNELLGFYEG